jgi:hypothetical protein
MKYLLYIFYRHYNRNKNNETAYWSALFALVAPAVLYGAAVYFYFFPENGVPDEPVCLIIGGIAACIIGYFVQDSIKERHIKKPELQQKYKSYHGYLAVVYVLAAITLFLLSAKRSNAISDEIIIKVIQNSNPVNSGEIKFKPPEQAPEAEP